MGGGERGSGFRQANKKDCKIGREKRNIQAEVWLLDAPNYNEWIDKVSEAWTGSIPATLANMPSKNIYEFKERAFTQEELTTWVDELLEMD